jgi:hypothetical protein
MQNLGEALSRFRIGPSMTTPTRGRTLFRTVRSVPMAITEVKKVSPLSRHLDSGSPGASCWPVLLGDTRPAKLLVINELSRFCS